MSRSAAPASSSSSASASAARPSTGAAANSSSQHVAASVTQPACCLLQYLRAREIGLAPPYLRTWAPATSNTRASQSQAPSTAAAGGTKRKAAELESTDADAAIAAAAALPCSSLLPCGSHLPSDMFSRALPSWRRGLLFPRPPPALRFRLSSLWDLKLYPRLQEHVFLSFDRTGTLLLSYLRSGTGAGAKRYTLYCWRFEPFKSLRVAATFDLFRSDAEAPRALLSEEQQLRRAMGLPGNDDDDTGGGGQEEDEAHLYIQLIEARDSSCFVIIGTPAVDRTHNSARHDQPVKALVSVVPSPAHRHSSGARTRTHETHFSFVSALSTPQMDLITLENESIPRAGGGAVATHCLMFSGVDCLLCLRFTMDREHLPLTAAAPAAETAAATSITSDDEPLRRSSSLLDGALSRSSWLHSVTCFCSASEAELPLVSASFRSQCWSLDVERFALDSCVGGSRAVRDYGFYPLAVEGIHVPSLARHTKTLLLAVSSAEPGEADEKGTKASTGAVFHVLGGSSTAAAAADAAASSSERFEVTLLHWCLEEGGSGPRIYQSSPLPWSQKSLRALVASHEKAAPVSCLSSAERLAQRAAQALLAAHMPRANLALLPSTTNNAPLHTGQSRPFILNPVFPYVIVL